MTLERCGLMLFVQPKNESAFFNCYMLIHNPKALNFILRALLTYQPPVDIAALFAELHADLEKPALIVYVGQGV